MFNSASARAFSASESLRTAAIWRAAELAHAAGVRPPEDQRHVGTVLRAAHAVDRADRFDLSVVLGISATVERRRRPQTELVDRRDAKREHVAPMQKRAPGGRAYGSALPLARFGG